jgi:2-keto-4-pentenoate hydratase
MSSNAAEQAAAFLVAARTPGAALTASFPPAFAPADTDAARNIQLATLARIGPIGGWKVGAASPTAEPACAPMPLAGIQPSGGLATTRLRFAEGEIAFRIGDALPPRDRPYTKEEVLAAIGSCQAAIELLDSRFADLKALDPASAAADLHHHGGFLFGAPIPAWSFAMFDDLTVELTATGHPAVRGIASNPAGTDLARLLVWLANSETVRAAGGLAEGTWVTTGSWTGMVPVEAGGYARVSFPGFEPVEVHFAP